MAIPEGYTSAPTSTDHLVKLAVPVPGHEPILIECPKIAWLAPDEQIAVRKYAEEIITAEQEVDRWHEVNDPLPETDRAEYPAAAAKKIGRTQAGGADQDKQFVLMREMRLRWVRPYLSQADYKTLTTSKKIPEATINWVVDQLKSADVTVGESEASSSS